jgi:cytochrome c
MLALTLTDGTSTATLHALSATFVPYGGWALGGGENEETTTESIHLLIQGANAGQSKALYRQSCACCNGRGGATNRQ